MKYMQHHNNAIAIALKTKIKKNKLKRISEKYENSDLKK